MSENTKNIYRVVVAITKTYDLLVEASSEDEAKSEGISKAITTQQIPKNSKAKCLSVKVTDEVGHIPTQMRLRHW